MCFFVHFSGHADSLQADTNKPLPKVPQLGSVLEREESAGDEENQESIDHVLTTSSHIKPQKQLKMLSSINTPKTEPRVSKPQMDPKTVHVSTSKPDSGRKLGFTDIPEGPRQSVGSAQNTPTRSDRKTPGFKFTFGSDATLSQDAQQMMDTVREDAARIKAEMLAQKNLQEQKDGEAEQMFNPYGRKIAQPKPKAGRFSDVHMAQFKKMDSIANHPSSFRGKPGYAMPTTTQSLKRSPSKAELDEPERPRTAGKGTPGRKQPPSFSGRPQISPYKVAATTEERADSSGPAKRMRRSEADDVSTSRPTETQSVKPSAIPRSTSSLFSPTKASLARTSQSASPAKQSLLPRSQTAKGIREAARKSMGRTSAAMSKFTSKLLEAQQESRKNSPMIARPASTTDLFSAAAVAKTPILPAQAGPTSFSSRLPTFSGLKSILRSPHKTPGDRQGTPKRPNTAAGIPESSKKVDFTPSVKSRYAVKLANNSPSPAKVAIHTPERSTGPVVPYDPAAYVLQDDDNDEAWEDAESSPVDYPSLPALSSEPKPAPVNHTVQQKAKELNRNSKDFKSIFTTLHPRPSSSGPQALPTAVADQVTKSPRNSSARKSRPSTIRRVRSSGSHQPIEPFADTEVHTMAHGLPAKKRRRESMYFDTREDTEEASKENQPVPGAWDDGYHSEDEGTKRAKRAKTLDFKDIDTEGISNIPSPKKKKSAAREAAARSARDRKSMIPGQTMGTPGKGVLSMSRLNMLSQPKRRA